MCVTSGANECMQSALMRTHLLLYFYLRLILNMLASKGIVNRRGRTMNGNEVNKLN